MSDTVAFFPEFEMHHSTSSEELMDAIIKAQNFFSPTPLPHNQHTCGEARDEIQEIFHLNDPLEAVVSGFESSAHVSITVSVKIILATLLLLMYGLLLSLCSMVIPSS